MFKWSKIFKTFKESCFWWYRKSIDATKSHIYIWVNQVGSSPIKIVCRLQQNTKSLTIYWHIMHLWFVKWCLNFLSSAINLAGSSNKTTVGVDFTFTCRSNARVIKFERDGVDECIMTGSYPNNTCLFFGNYSKSFMYNCNNSTGVYNLIIPGSFDIDALHGSNWTCIAPLAIQFSSTIQLYVYGE